MPNLLEILSVLQPEVSFANMAKLSEIITTILRLSVPITTRAIGRFGRLSLRTVERFYARKPLSWTLIRILLFRAFLFDSSAIHLLVLDETTEKKAGKCRFGGHIVSSIKKKNHIQFTQLLMIVFGNRFSASKLTLSLSLF